MKPIIIISIIAVLAFLFFKMNNKDNSNQVKEWIKSGATLVDVRNPDEFETGSVPNAVNYPLPEITEHLSDLKDDERIIVFCRSGNRSQQAMTILKENGIDQVINGGSWNEVNEAYEEVNK